MDVNGLRCWHVADARAFGVGDGAQNLAWRADVRQLRLARQQAGPALAENAAYARSQAQKASPVANRDGSWAWWSGTDGTLLAAGIGPGSVPLALAPDSPPGVPQPTDLALGDDDILYVARNDAVIMSDRRERFADTRVALAGFRAQRLCPAAGGGAWVLDRVDGTLALLGGQPLRRGGYAPPAETHFVPKEPNPRPPRLRRLSRARLPAGREGIALAGSRGGRVAVLAWTAQDAELYTLQDFELRPCGTLAGLRFPYALAWIGEDRVALLASDGAAPAAQAVVYEVDVAGADGTLLPTGEVHPLPGLWDGGFVNVLDEVPRYPVCAQARDVPVGLRRLRAVSRASYARSGRVQLGPFDGGQAGAVWHRLQLELALPDHAGLRIWAHADDAGAPPEPPAETAAGAWSPHVAGAAAQLPEWPQAPQAAWCDSPSEIAFHPGLLDCAPQRDRHGRFTVLLQRAGRRVRRIEGRWLYLTLELLGDGQVTPSLAALRIYGARFSYRDRYLPALYHERLSGPDADAAGSATPPDFLERFLALFEAPLTELEGRVAHSWLLTEPAAAPPAALPWLASWIGLPVTPGEAAPRLRQRLRAAPRTARLHGTLGGLLAELELATGGEVVSGGELDPYQEPPRVGERALARIDGAAGAREVDVLVLELGARGGSTVLAGGSVTRGEIVVVEGFRLRRTFATILGADLADHDDPLTLGAAVSGNSFVGDSLILGDAARREVTALFADDLPRDRADRAAVRAFLASLAHRVLVLVRSTPRTVDLPRLRAVATAAAPAHVQLRLVNASRPLIVGAASLVGVDSFLAAEPPVRPVRVGRSRVGQGDRVMGQGRLDPRAPATPAPVGVIDGPAALVSGSSFILSSGRSRAARGRRVSHSIWTWQQP